MYVTTNIMDMENFFQNAKNNVRDIIEPLTLETLVMMLKEDVRYLDAHYIHNRTQEIIQKTIDKLKFKNEEIRKARRAFLDVLLEGAQNQLYGFDDDRKEAKKNLKNKKTKQEAKDVLDKLDRLEEKRPNDRTERRDMECEPICQMIASSLLSGKYALQDERFVDGSIEIDNKLLLETLTRFMFDELMDQLVLSLDESYKKANEKHWGCRRDEVRMKQIDNRLKE